MKKSLKSPGNMEERREEKRRGEKELKWLSRAASGMCTYHKDIVKVHSRVNYFTAWWNGVGGIERVHATVKARIRGKGRVSTVPQ